MSTAARRRFYSSDHHLGHHRALSQYRRPFGSVEEMNAVLLRNWNETVTDDDVGYVVGDLCAHSLSEAETRALFEQMRGEKHLVIGNHDELNGYVLELPWASMGHIAKIQDGDDRIFLSHYAHVTWPDARFGSYHLYGHTHGELPGTRRSLDVSVDATGFKPVTFEQAKAMMAAMPAWPVQPRRWAEADAAL